MKKNYPGKRVSLPLTINFMRIKLTPLPKLTARARSDCLKQRARMLSKCLCGETVGPYHGKGDRSRRGILLAERKCAKRWHPGRLNPCTLDNVSAYKGGLKWLTGNWYRVVTWPKY